MDRLSIAFEQQHHGKFTGLKVLTVEFYRSLEVPVRARHLTEVMQPMSMRCLALLLHVHATSSHLHFSLVHISTAILSLEQTDHRAQIPHTNNNHLTSDVVSIAEHLVSPILSIEAALRRSTGFHEALATELGVGCRFCGQRQRICREKQDIPTMSTFCQHCKVLQFDDSICGGHVTRSDTNEDVLAFADDQIFEFENEEGAKERILTLDYARQDVLPDLPGLNETAVAGCQFCWVLRRSIRGYTRLKWIESVNQRLFIVGVEYAWVCTKQGGSIATCSWRLELRFNIEFEKTKSSTGEVTFEICAPEGSLATWLGVSQMPPVNDILTPEKLSWINNGISECEKSCNHKRLNNSLPTRLIHVGNRTGNVFENPRLVITAGQGVSTKDFATKRLEYAILSYCWGDSTASTLKTEQANLEDHLKEIRLEDMAATCRDAVLVARAIGIEWLWIDALCILQDDKEDWEKESSRMGEAYGNAFLTIVPITNESSSESFLAPEPSSIGCVDIPFKSMINPTIEGTYTAWSRLSAFFDAFDSLSVDLSVSKWDTRGWTFQEGKMSIRRLYFGGSGIHLGCENMTKRDDGTSVRGMFDMSGDWIHNEEDIYSYWYQLMGSYSTRIFAFEKDILPAVSAMAIIISHRTGDDYLCGLWASDLAVGLLWEVADPLDKLGYEEHMDRILSLEAYLGPSWSWTNPARNNAYVEWSSRVSEPIMICEIIEAKSIVEGKNPFGCIQSAHILIRGQSRSLPGPNLYQKLFPNRAGQYWTVVESGYFTAECQLDWKVNEALEYIVEDEKGQENGHDEEVFRRSGLTGASASWLHDLVMLAIGQDFEGKTMNGLLLVRAERENEWYRVGVFRELSGEKEGRNPLQNWETCTFKLV